MKKIPKQVSAFCALIVALLSFLLIGCTSDISGTPTKSLSKDLNTSCLEQINQEMPSLFDANLSATDLGGSRMMGLAAGARPLTNKTVYVEMAQAKSIKEAGLQKVNTIGDAMLLVEREAACFSFEPTEFSVDSFVLSEEKAMEALAPYIKISKNYLVALGFCDAEIQNMLKECGASEEILVPVLFSLIGEEGYQLNTNVNEADFQIVNGNSENSTMGKGRKLGECALTVLGFDLFIGWANASFTITRAAIVKVIQSHVARIAGGPLAIALFVGQVWWCYTH